MQTNRVCHEVGRGVTSLVRAVKTAGQADCVSRPRTARYCAWDIRAGKWDRRLPLSPPGRPARGSGWAEPGFVVTAAPAVDRWRTSRVRHLRCPVPEYQAGWIRGRRTQFSSAMGEVIAIATDDARINDRIRARQVRLIGADGQQLGVKPLPEALRSPGSKGSTSSRSRRTPTRRSARSWTTASTSTSRTSGARNRSEGDERRHQGDEVPAEDRRARLQDQDEARRALPGRGLKVKLTIMFRGREMAHPELGRRILERVAEQVERDRDRRGGTPPGRPQHDDGAQPHRARARAASAASRPKAARAAERASRSHADRRPSPKPQRQPAHPSTDGVSTMPKMKTHRGAAKRFKVTGTGKIRRRKPFRAHLLEKKSTGAPAASAAGRGHRRRPQARRAPAGPVTRRRQSRTISRTRWPGSSVPSTARSTAARPREAEGYSRLAEPALPQGQRAGHALAVRLPRPPGPQG